MLKLRNRPTAPAKGDLRQRAGRIGATLAILVVAGVLLSTRAQDDRAAPSAERAATALALLREVPKRSILLGPVKSTPRLIVFADITAGKYDAFQRDALPTL